MKLSLCESMNQPPPACRESLGGMENQEMTCRASSNGVRIGFEICKMGCLLVTFGVRFAIYALKNQFVLRTQKKLSPLCSIDSLVRSAEKTSFFSFLPILPVGRVRFEFPC